jgi:hypothetical protein
MYVLSKLPVDLLLSGSEHLQRPPRPLEQVCGELSTYPATSTAATNVSVDGEIPSN